MTIYPNYLFRSSSGVYIDLVKPGYSNYGDVSVLDIDTPQILVNTYPQSIRIHFF